MSMGPEVEDQDDIVYVDLTQYDGPFPPPPDYGLTNEQYTKFKEIKKTKPLRGLWVWGLPLLAFVLPNDICSVFKPLGWFVNLLGYVFPVLHVVRDTYSNGQMVQVVFGATLLGVAVYMPCNLSRAIYELRARLNLSRYSMFMVQQRIGYGPGFSPRSWRQLMVFFIPVSFIILLYVSACDVMGYFAIYVLHTPEASIANWHLWLGGVLSGAGWLHGFVYSYVASNRPAGFALSRLGVLIQAYTLLGAFLVVVGFPLIVYQFHAVGGILRWKRQLAREEAYFTDKQSKKRKK
jgi:hypothetical protein